MLIACTVPTDVAANGEFEGDVGFECPPQPTPIAATRMKELISARNFCMNDLLVDSLQDTRDLQGTAANCSPRRLSIASHYAEP
jgi:hypothetical protein